MVNGEKDEGSTMSLYDALGCERRRRRRRCDDDVMTVEKEERERFWDGESDE